MKILFCWLGNTDLRASEGVEGISEGPIAQAVNVYTYDKAVIISDHSIDKSDSYVKWLKDRYNTDIDLRSVVLESPTDFGSIYKIASAIVDEVIKQSRDNVQITFHLSPGTPAMAAVWVILAKTKYLQAELIESSLEAGVKTVSFPFELSAEFIPDLLKKPDEKLKKLSDALPPEAPEFDSIIHRCDAMKILIAKARVMALRDVPVMIQGESGTGKELFARAIHNSSPRNTGPFVAVNCGAIPENIIEAELFGYEKGAFTGAEKSKMGYFEAASGGTLFLDEIGELPLFSQVKLLRVIQEGELTRLGSVQPIKIDFRLITATNRNLAEEVGSGDFREDLFHRIAIGILNIPPLRDRKGDISLIIDALLKRLNEELASQPGFSPKKLSPSTRRALLEYSWPGNIRELNNTLLRAMIWTAGDSIELQDIEESILDMPVKEESILNRSLDGDFDINKVIGEMVGHYFKKALQESNGVKKKAAELVGLPNYQTFTNWMKRYGVKLK